MPSVGMNECFPIILISLHQKLSTVVFIHPFQARSNTYSVCFVFIGLVTVANFREDDHEQAYIPPRSFYCRYELEYKTRKIQVALLSLIANSSLFIVALLYSPNLDQKHVFVRSLTCLKTSTN